MSNYTSSLLADPMFSDNWILSNRITGIRRYPLSEIKGYHRFPTIGIVSDPTRIFSDPIGSDGMISTWAILYRRLLMITFAYFRPYS
jgi:hypothetical protein